MSVAKKWGKARKIPVIVEFREVEPKEVIAGRGSCASTEIIDERIRGEIIETKEGPLCAQAGIDYIVKDEDGKLCTVKIEGFFEKYEVIVFPSDAKKIRHFRNVKI